MTNVNTSEYWNKIYKREGPNTWRNYEKTNQNILKIIGKNKTVKEYGCGMGILAKQIIANKNAYIGIDISSEPKQTIEDAGGIFVQANILDLKEHKLKIHDYVIATEFLEHFENPDQIIEIMKQSLKKDGTLILAVPNNCLGPDECKEHYQKFTPATLKEILQKHFKEITTYEYIDFVPNTQIALPTLMVVVHD